MIFIRISSFSSLHPANISETHVGPLKIRQAQVKRIAAARLIVVLDPIFHGFAVPGHPESSLSWGAAASLDSAGLTPASIFSRPGSLRLASSRKASS
jgi:hypothetical protein